MTTAGWALAISISVAVWEFATWFINGARVRVTLRSGNLHDDYALHEASTWPRLREMTESQRVGGWPVEVAVIEVENAGRTAVTISDVTFDLGRARNRRFGFGRHTFGMVLLNAPGATQQPTVRLEPFDRAKFVLEAWPVVPAALKARNDELARRRQHRSGRTTLEAAFGLADDGHGLPAPPAVVVARAGTAYVLLAASLRMCAVVGPSSLGHGSIDISPRAGKRPFVERSLAVRSKCDELGRCLGEDAGPPVVLHLGEHRGGEHQELDGVDLVVLVGVDGVR